MNIVSEHRLRNDPAEARHLAAWVEAFARQAQLPRPLQSALDHALTECVANVIAHAYDDVGEHWITIRFRSTNQDARVEVEDDGREFDPRTVPPVDVSAPLETRAVGGLGVQMMCQFMDVVEYRRENGRNILTLIKRIS